MAVTVKGETDFGEERELYWRLNNFEQLANHGVKAVARFRAFASEEAFRSGKHFMAEKLIEFDVNTKKPVWSQAYAALRLEPGFKDATPA